MKKKKKKTQTLHEASLAHGTDRKVEDSFRMVEKKKGVSLKITQ